MSKIRRYYIPNSTIFITTVTKERIRIFDDKSNIQLLWDVIHKTQVDYSFDLTAYVILPEHIHLLLTLKNQEANFSKIINLIKGRFTTDYKYLHKIRDPVSLWQKGFWDHVIRNEKDLKNHMDYIHWNPVKHRLTDNPRLWEYSSYSQWYSEGFYISEWGKGTTPLNISEMDFE